MNRKARVMSFTVALCFVVSASAIGQEWWNEKQADGGLDQRNVTLKQGETGIVESASRVKWDDGYIEVLAGATADMKHTVNLAHAYSVAAKTARHLAYEKLAETAAGINITADARYDRELMRDANVRTELRALVKNARVVNEEQKRMTDGSVWVEVTLGLLLNSSEGLMSPMAQWIDKGPFIDKPVLFRPEPEAISGMVTPGTAYTGLIVDAGGLQATPAMLPRILTSGGRELYGPNAVNRTYMINQGLVGYADSVAKARDMKRVGSNPLVIRAAQLDSGNKANIVLDEKDAVMVAAADAGGQFLRDCKVVVVIN